jgi:hypothetical protein
MKDLIEALTILLKYGNPYCPTGCEHDELRVYINPDSVSDEDLDKLRSLGVYPDDEVDECFKSYRFGSA